MKYKIKLPLVNFHKKSSPNNVIVKITRTSSFSIPPLCFEIKYRIVRL